VQADLDGDGQADRVTVSPVPNTRQQNLTATVGGVTQVVQVPWDSSSGVQAPRVVDVNDDGRDEVLVTESVGANTDGFSLWGIFYGSDSLRPVVGVDQAPPRLWEGGGASVMSRYGCEVAGGNRELVTVSALRAEAPGEYFEGERVTYRPRGDGVATSRSRASAEGFRESVVFQAGPAACA